MSISKKLKNKIQKSCPLTKNKIKEFDADDAKWAAATFFKLSSFVIFDGKNSISKTFKKPLKKNEFIRVTKNRKGEWVLRKVKK